jgi:hypothetical protein
LKKRRSSINIPEESPEILKPFNANKADAYIRNLKKIVNSPARTTAPASSKQSLFGTRVDRQLEEVISGKASNLLQQKRSSDDEEEEEEDQEELVGSRGELAYYDDE